MAKERLQKHPASDEIANLGQREAQQEKASRQKLEKMESKKKAESKERKQHSINPAR
jgi:hypothetical protein